MNAWGALAAAAGAATVYAAAMVRRNRSLEPPPVRDYEGEAYPEHEFVFSDGERISFIDTGSGSGPSFVLLPGADGVKETFRFQIPALAESYRIISPDLRAEVPARAADVAPGAETMPAVRDSARARAEATLDRFGRDLVELTDALETGPFILLGQSLGGALAMHFAARHSERVRALIVANSLTRVSYEHVGFNRTALAPLAMATTRYLPTSLARLAARVWMRSAAWIYDDSPGADAIVEYALWTGPRPTSPTVSDRRVAPLRSVDLREDLPRIGAPTLILKGPRDAYCPPEWSREMARLIPDARYEEIPGTGHCSHISRPLAFNRLLMDWLAARQMQGLGVAGTGAPESGNGARPEAET